MGRFPKDEAGISTVEYDSLLALVAASAIAIGEVLSVAVSGRMTDAAGARWVRLPVSKAHIDAWATALILAAISWFAVEFVLAVIAG